MASKCITSHWEAPKFTFSPPNQTDEWKAFYIFAAEFLKAMDIDTESEDYTKKGWKQLHMIFEAEDNQAIHTLINNGTIIPEDQKVPIRVLHAIQAIKEEEHIWHYSNEILSDLRQTTDQGIQALSNCITTLINNAKFTHPATKETFKIMLLQHTVSYTQGKRLD